MDASLLKMDFHGYTVLIFIKNWCSIINASLPRITDETEQKVIADFIQNATRKYKFDGIQTIFVNHINHTVGNWSWVNGQTNKGFTVKAVSSTGKDDYFFGYLWTDDYLIYQSRSETRRYICESYFHLNNFSRCEIKLGNRCYWKKDVPLTWHRSREACLNEGGDLASLVTFGQKNLNDSLKDLRLNANKGYWVGLYKDVVWRWNARGFDSEIKYSNWKTGHPSNYNAKCLCLDKSSNYEWIECECDKEYAFICKRNETTVQISLTTSYPPMSSEISVTSVHSLPLHPMETSTLLSPESSIPPIYQMETSLLPATLSQSRPTDQMPSSSVTSETVRLSLVLCSCALIVIIFLVVASFVIRKQRIRKANSNVEPRTTRTTANEFPIYAQIQRPRGIQSAANRSASSTAPVNSSSDETSETMTTATANEFQVYAEIEEAIETQSTANWSASDTTYANVQPPVKTKNEHQINNVVYAELDILQR